MTILLGERVSKLDLSIDFDNFNERSIWVCGVIRFEKLLFLLKILLDLQSLDPNSSLLAIICLHLAENHV